jgi:hypothetical protein
MNFTRRGKVTGRAKAITKARPKIRTVVRDVATARVRTKLWVPITAKGEAKVSLANRTTAKVLVRSRRKMDRAHRIRAKGR